MKKRVGILFIILSLIFSTISAIPVFADEGGNVTGTVYTDADFQKLKKNFQDMYVGVPDYDLTDPSVISRIAKINSDAYNRWGNGSMIKDGVSRFWPDFEQDPANLKTNKDTLLCNRVRALALAYATYGSDYYKNPDLLKDILYALNFIVDKINYVGAEHYDSGWDWEIGIQSALAMTVLILDEDEVPEELREKVADSINYHCPNYDSFYPDWPASVGANRSWKCYVRIMSGIIGKDSGPVLEGIEGLGVLFKRAKAEDGFLDDGSYIFHVACAYTGGYSINEIKDVISILRVLGGTPFSISGPVIEDFYKLVFEAYEPLIYNGTIMDSTLGRNVSRPDNTGKGAAKAIINCAVQLAQTAPPEYEQRIKSVAKQWILDFGIDGYFTDLPLGDIKINKELMEDESITPRGDLTKTTIYGGMDRIVHMFPDYCFSLSMSSARAYNFEHANNENKKGFYYAEGMTYLYNKNDPAQYDNIWPAINPYRIPGTTVDTRVRPDADGQKYRSTSFWSGGSELQDTYGTAGMELSAYGSTLTAKKSWFMFDDEIVCLGADINSTDGRAIETIIENRKLNAAADNTLTVNGTAKSSALGWSEAMADVNRIHLEGTAGYYFPEPVTVNGLRETRTGDWSDVGASNGPVTWSFMTLWLDHGISPANGTYQYAILPNLTSTQTDTYASNPEFTVLENSNEAQAVKETGLHITGINFWKNMTKTVDIITSNKQASVTYMEAGNEIEVAVSDPTQINEEGIEIEVNRSARNIVSQDPGITVTQLSPTIKFIVDVKGARGRSFAAKFTWDPEVPEGTPQPGPTPTPPPEGPKVLGYNGPADFVDGGKVGRNSIDAFRYRAASEMTVDKLNFEVHTAIPAAKVKFAIYSYSEDAIGNIGTLLGETSQVTNVPLGLNTIYLKSPVTIEAGKYYWICVTTDNNNFRIGATPDSCAMTCMTLSYSSGVWPNTLPRPNTFANYRFTIYAMEHSTSDVSLRDLKVDGKTIAGFNPNVYEYTVVLPKGTQTPGIVSADKAEANSTDPVITQATAVAEHDTTPGAAARATIVLSSEDGITTRTYTVIFKEGDTDTSLSILTISGISIPGFNPAVRDYVIIYPYGVKTPPKTVTATAKDTRAEVAITQAATVNAYGTEPVATDKATVVVTAEDKTTKGTYTITFKAAANKNAYLSDLTVEGITITGFGPTVYDYTVICPAGTQTPPVIAAAPIDMNAAVAITQATTVAAHNAVPGATDKATVVVTAEDGTTVNTYTVTFKEAVWAPAMDKVFSLGSIVMSGSAEISGDTGTNSVEAGSVDFKGNAQINGSLFVGPGVDWTTVVVSTKPDPQSNVTGAVYNLSSAGEYHMLKFPAIPELPAKGDLNAGWWPAGPHTVSESGCYGVIDVTNSLTVNVGNEDIHIVADKLSVTGSGSIAVNRTGTGRLILHIRDEVQLAGSCSVNKDGDSNALILYYSGGNALNLDGTVSFTGNLFAEKSNIVIGGSASVKGHLVTGGSKIDIAGNAEVDSGAIYAPNAALSLSGSGKIKGMAVAGSITMVGNARIIYDNSIYLNWI